MEIKAIKKIIARYLPNHNKRIQEIKKAEKYYENRNDILNEKNPTDKDKKNSDGNPMRSADNRVSHPWHQLLVDQKAAYSMTIPPTFDVEDEDMNSEVEKLLGDSYAKVAKDLAVNAANAGESWIHVWKDHEYENFFRYAVVDSKQIIAIYDKKLNEKLKGILRVYDDFLDNGDEVVVYEYWNDKECHMFSRPKDASDDDLVENNTIQIIDKSTGEVVETTNNFEHDWPGYVPFVRFSNNPLRQSDLQKYKKLIDVYDKVYSGFINDLDDVQEIIYVLTNYGGEDKQEFLNDLKRFKMVQLEADKDEPGGIETLAIEIPVEARTKMLEITREAIFTHGQGVDPQKNIGQNNSGVALKHMYSLLELKVSMLETEFRQGFAELVRFILFYFDSDPDVSIKQTWTRTAINDDLEKADVISKLAPVTSQETIAKQNPLVEDWQQEIEQQQKEADDEMRAIDDYRDKEAEEDLKNRIGEDDGEEEDE